MLVPGIPVSMIIPHVLSDRMCFDTLLFLIPWLIWKERNRRTFDRRTRNLQELLALIDDEAVMWF